MLVEISTVNLDVPYVNNDKCLFLVLCYCGYPDPAFVENEAKWDYAVISLFAVLLG